MAEISAAMWVICGSINIPLQIYYRHVVLLDIKAFTNCTFPVHKTFLYVIYLAVSIDCKSKAFINVALSLLLDLLLLSSCLLMFY